MTKATNTFFINKKKNQLFSVKLAQALTLRQAICPCILLVTRFSLFISFSTAFVQQMRSSAHVRMMVPFECGISRDVLKREFSEVMEVMSNVLTGTLRRP